MGVHFLSDEWFDKVKELKQASGDIQVAEELEDLKINLTVSNDSGETEACLNSGFFDKGHQEDAAATIITTEELAFKIFIENDQAAGMQGFMSGELRVEGDMSKIMALQTVQPTEAHRAFQTKVKEFSSL